MKKYTLITFLCFLTSILLQIQSLQAENNKLKYSVVRIVTSYQRPSFYYPWRWNSARQKSGQGIVVGKNLVLTLAANVKNASIIEMLLNSEPVPTQLKIKAISLDANLALLEGPLPGNAIPLDIPPVSKFIRNEPLSLYWKTAIGMLMKGSAMLDRGDSINLSYQSMQSHIVYQAIRSSQPNTGYGVPVFDKNNKFFGLALKSGNEYDFSIITCDIINRTFDLQKAALKKQTAIKGFAIQPLTQVYYRQKLGLTEKSGGCLISKVFGQGSGYNQLQKGDVLLDINGRKLDAWGRYEHPIFGLLFFSHIFSEHYINEKLPIVIMRNKQKIKIDLQLSNIDDSKWLIPSNPFLHKTEFLIRGGFIFIPLTRTYLMEWGLNFRNKAPFSLVVVYDKYLAQIKNKKIKDLVLLSRIMPHPSNVGLQRLGGMIIDKVDGQPLQGLKQLKKILDQTDKKVIKFSFSPADTPLWLSPKTLKDADKDIQTRYGITQLEFFIND